MKKTALFMMCVATLAMFASCGSLSSSSNTVALASGQTCGAAVLNLYRAYKSTGTIDLTNASNLTNALALATCYTQIKQNKDDQNYRKAFTNGLILSSAGLITSQNAGNFVNALLMANGLESLNSNSGTTTATTTTTTNNSSSEKPVINLIKTL